MICIFCSISCLATDPQKTYLLIQALLMGQISAIVDQENDEKNSIARKDDKPINAHTQKIHKKKFAINKTGKKSNIRH